MSPPRNPAPSAMHPGARLALESLPPTLKQYLHQLACADTPVSALMGHEAVSVGPETAFESVARVLLEHELQAVAVVDAAGALTGVVSVFDLLRHDGRPGRTVRDVMTPTNLSLPDGASVAEVASRMSLHGASHVAIGCSRCRGYCVVSALDLVRWLSTQSGMSPLRDLSH